jgi:hypothetical protein
MFIEEHGAAALLLAIVFMSLGFLLGKATSPHGHGNHRVCQSAPTCTHGSDEGVQHITPPSNDVPLDEFNAGSHEF